LQLTFKNQLTNDEIKEGVNLFIRRKILYNLFVIIGVSAALAILNRDKIQGAQILLPIGIMAVFVLGFHLYLRKVMLDHFSPEKVANYSFNADGLDITGNDGKVYSYSYSKLKVLESKKALVLIFGKNSFAIISKAELTPEEINLIKGLRDKK